MTDLSADAGVEPAKKKRKKGTSPTARSLAECRKRGWVAQVVERYNPHAHVLQDLFGCIDIVAITDKGIMAIQATGGDGGVHAARVAKVLAEPRAKKWIDAGGRFEVWSWAMRGAAGTRKMWTLRVEDIAETMRSRACVNADSSNEETHA
jgi:hypothetical protein